LVFLQHLKLVSHANPLVGFKIKLWNGAEVYVTDLVFGREEEKAVLLENVDPWRSFELWHVLNNVGLF